MSKTCMRRSMRAYTREFVFGTEGAQRVSVYLGAAEKADRHLHAAPVVSRLVNAGWPYPPSIRPSKQNAVETAIDGGNHIGGGKVHCGDDVCLEEHPADDTPSLHVNERDATALHGRNLPDADGEPRAVCLSQ